MDTMNIYAKHGDKIKVTEETKHNGYDSDFEWVCKHLTINKEYTVYEIDVGGSISYVTLVEFPETSFNTVNFVDVRL